MIKGSCDFGSAVTGSLLALFLAWRGSCTAFEALVVKPDWLSLFKHVKETHDNKPGKTSNTHDNNGPVEARLVANGITS